MKKLMLAAMLLGATFFALPSTGFAQENGRHERRAEERQDRRQDRKWDRHSDRRRFNRRVRETYGYRNYGQYRRTQVGNRRYRMVTKSYWNNGVRRTRTVRVNY